VCFCVCTIHIHPAGSRGPGVEQYNEGKTHTQAQTDRHGFDRANSQGFRPPE
jgi:hypothetical protein